MTLPQYAPVDLRTKILSFRKDAVRLHKGEMVAPTMAIVYPTYSCNMRCFGCISNAENATPSSINLDVFDNFVSDFAGMGGESLEFSGGGEPTLHPKFGQLVDIVAKADLQFGMITNGTKPDVCRNALAYSGTRYLRISVYTVSQLQYVRRICEIRSDLGSHCRIGGKILLGSSSVPAVGFLTQEILDAGVDFVSIKAKRHSSDDPELLPEKSKLLIEDTIQDLRTRWPGRVFGGITKTQQHGACWLSPLHTVIDALGTVWVCCYYQDRVEDISIGTLTDVRGSFRDLWVSPAHRAAMQRVIIPECDFYDCRFHVYHDVMNEELRDDGSHLAFI
jgi:Radical SAM superfamily/Iron-sulfur cluster-binding domain